MKAYIHAVSFCHRILTLRLLKQDILLLRAEMDIVSLLYPKLSRWTNHTAAILFICKLIEVVFYTWSLGMGALRDKFNPNFNSML